jgi:hypothetical protein
MSKKEIVEICPKCGCKSFLSTSEGSMCKNCQCIVDKFVPLPPKQDEN